MVSDGKQLETLVAFIEKSLLPQGFEVDINNHVYNEDRAQIAEFDIEIRGMIGSTSFAWLIECRDRPSGGVAPGSWIEQLVGRRSRFGFDKVTAVSTTGFSPSAVDYATKAGIEIREVKALSADEFDGWLVKNEIHIIENLIELKHASILPLASESENRKSAAVEASSTASLKSQILLYSKTGKSLSFSEAFCGAVIGGGTFFDDVVPNGKGKQLQLCGQVHDDDPLFIQTAIGLVRIHSILFKGELRVKEFLAPLSAMAEYRHAATGQSISKYAAYAPQKILGENTSIEMHRFSESGEEMCVIRMEPPKNG